MCWNKPSTRNFRRPGSGIEIRKPFGARQRSGSTSVPVTRENALAHAAVVRSVLDRTTPLPFRFGTIVTEQQLQSYLSTHRPALENKLAPCAAASR